MQRVDVFLAGAQPQQADLQDRAARLARLAAIDEALALRLLKSRAPLRIRRDVTLDEGRRYCRALDAIGVEALLCSAAPASEAGAALPQPGPETGVRRADKPSAPIILGPRARSVPLLGPRPQAARTTAHTPPVPRSSSFSKAGISLLVPLRPANRGMAAPRPRGPRARRAREWLDTPRVVPALQGWEWLRQSWQMFAEQPVQWLGLLLAACGLFVFLLLTPGPHFFLLLMALPVVLGFLVAAAHGQNLDEAPHPLQLLLLAGKSWKALLLFGLFSLLLVLFLGTLFFLLAGLGLFSRGETAAGLYLRQGEPLVLAGLALLAGLTCIPALSGYLFTIPLVVLADYHPLHAYRLGVYGCVRNWKAVLVVLLVCTIVLLLSAALLGSARLLLPWPWLSLLLVGLALPAAVLGLLLAYNAFRDIFAGMP